MADACCNALKKCRHDLRKKKGVLAVGRGIKKVGGKSTGRMSIIVTVSKKVSAASLAPSDVIPKSVEGVETDVIESTVFKAPVPAQYVAESVYTDRHRPCPGGVSIGHHAITAGTFGCVVRDRITKELLILSNNHVLANSNNAQAGDPILQPGPYDGGTLGSDTIGSLLRYIDIVFGGGGGGIDLPGCLTGLLGGLFKKIMSKSSVAPNAAENLVDCALARPVLSSDIITEILDIGAVSGHADADVGQAVRKAGRTTGFTTGEILQTDVTVNVQYGEGLVAVFTDQLMAGAMSQGGDSGSAIVDGSNRLVGLLFAGSDQYTIMNRSANVLSALNIEV